MFDKILLYALLGVVAVFGVVATVQHFQIIKLEVTLSVRDNTIIEKDNAIQAYEELLKVIPFNRMVEERIIDAREDINASLNNDSAISDGSYRM